MKYLSVLSCLTSSISLRLAARTFLSTSKRMIVGYATDVEGNVDYWNQYLSVSKVLEKKVVAKNEHIISLKDNCHFVYGGDTCDRGPGSMRVLKDLVQLKESYPDRVHLILGNRDINKLRMQFSMHPSVLKTLPLVKWLKAPPEETVGPHYRLCDEESKMKWILSKTMGSPIAYDMCKLEAQQTSYEECIKQPWRSFLDMTDPATGLLTRYLELAQVAARIGDVLFVHGAKHEHNFGWLPPTVDSMKCSASVSASLSNPLVGSRRTQDLDLWVREINAFVHSELRDYRQRTPAFLEFLAKQDAAEEAQQHVTNVGSAGTVGTAGGGVSDGGGSSEALIRDVEKKGDNKKVQIWESVGGYHHPQPGSRLLQYGMGRLAGGAINPSVVYSTYLQQPPPQQQQQQQSTQPNAVSVQAAQWLLHNGVRAVVVGHQPVGDAPLIMHAHGVQMLSMDTSYSADVLWPLSQLTAIARASARATVANAIGSGGTDGVLVDSSANAASAALSSAAVLPSAFAVDTSTEWITYADFEKRRLQGIKSDDAAAAVTAVPKSTSSVPEPASSVSFKSTRSPQAAFELTIEVPNSTDDGRASKLEIFGLLSGAVPFAFRSDSNNSMDSYIGRTTTAGWMVRLSGVRPFVSSSKDTGADASRASIVGVEDYYLLSHVDGYTFRNRLVRRDLIAKEFESAI